MANYEEPMDIDCMESDFDNKENTCSSNVLKGSNTEKFYEGLDTSESNFRLRYSTTPNSSPMSKSCLVNCTNNLDNKEVADNGNLTRSLGPSTVLNDTIIKSPKLPLKDISVKHIDEVRTPLGQTSLDRTLKSVSPNFENPNLTVSEHQDNDIDENISFPSSSSSSPSTPVATTPTKEILKPTGSPIMRGIKSVLNMFRPSQSQINDLKDDPVSHDTIDTNPIGMTSDNLQLLASTPIASHRQEDKSVKSNTLRDSIVFNEELANELQWNNDSTIIFCDERAPIHKLLLPNTLSSSSSNYSNDSCINKIGCNINKQKEVEQNLNITAEPMDISYNNSTIKEKIPLTVPTMSDTQYLNETYDDSVFVDCESSINESELLRSIVETVDTVPLTIQDYNKDEEINNTITAYVNKSKSIGSAYNVSDINETETKVMEENKIPEHHGIKQLYVPEDIGTVEQRTCKEELSIDSNQSLNENIMQTSYLNVEDKTLTNEEISHIKIFGEDKNIARSEINEIDVNYESSVHPNLSTDRQLSNKSVEQELQLHNQTTVQISEVKDELVISGRKDVDNYTEVNKSTFALDNSMNVIVSVDINHQNDVSNENIVYDTKDASNSVCEDGFENQIDNIKSIIISNKPFNELQNNTCGLIANKNDNNTTEICGTSMALLQCETNLNDNSNDNVLEKHDFKIKTDINQSTYDKGECQTALILNKSDATANHETDININSNYNIVDNSDKTDTMKPPMTPVNIIDELQNRSLTDNKDDTISISETIPLCQSGTDPNINFNDNVIGLSDFKNKSNIHELFLTSDKTINELKNESPTLVSNIKGDDIITSNEFMPLLQTESDLNVSSNDCVINERDSKNIADTKNSIITLVTSEKRITELHDKSRNLIFNNKSDNIEAAYENEPSFPSETNLNTNSDEIVIEGDDIGSEGDKVKPNVTLENTIEFLQHQDLTLFASSENDLMKAIQETHMFNPEPDVNSKCDMVPLIKETLNKFDKEVLENEKDGNHEIKLSVDSIPLKCEIVNNKEKNEVINQFNNENQLLHQDDLCNTIIREETISESSISVTVKSQTITEAKLRPDSLDSLPSEASCNGNAIGCNLSIIPVVETSVPRNNKLEGIVDSLSSSISQKTEICNDVLSRNHIIADDNIKDNIEILDVDTENTEQQIIQTSLIQSDTLNHPNVLLKENMIKESIVEAVDKIIAMDIKPNVVKEIVYSEDNSPYVSVIKDNDGSMKSLEFNEFTSETDNSISFPTISPKGQPVIDFNEIHNPFVTKSKIRMSPPPSNLTTLDAILENDVITKSGINSHCATNEYHGQGLKTNNLTKVEEQTGIPLEDNIFNTKKSIDDKLDEPELVKHVNDVNVPQNILNNNLRKDGIQQIGNTPSTQNIEGTEVAKNSLSFEQSIYFSAESPAICTDVNSDVNPFITRNKLSESFNYCIEEDNPFISKSKLRLSPLTIEGDNQNIPNVSMSYDNSKDTDVNNKTSSESNTEDDDTIEGPFLEQENDFVDIETLNDKHELNTFTDANIPIEENCGSDEMFIDADAFEYLMNQNGNNMIDGGKESLFLKFDPLCAKINSDGVVVALSQIQKKQSTFDITTDKDLEKQETLNLTFGDTISENSSDDLNVTVSHKPMMAVIPAVNSVPTSKNQTETPSRVRQSTTFNSPAITVIDRLLNISANNSPIQHNLSMTQNETEHTRNSEAEIALIQLRQLLTEREENIQELKSESIELKARLKTLETQMKVLETENSAKHKRINDLNEILVDKTKRNKNMAAVVEEYERTISGLIADTELEKKKHSEERTKLINERDEQTAHLASMEVSFSDLHSKYEKSKHIILNYKANEDTYKKSITEFEESLKKFENNYELLKQHATAKLNNANQELEKINKSHEAEVLKFNAMIKRKDMHITSLEETLAQKTKANEELTAICDELISKVG